MAASRQHNYWKWNNFSPCRGNCLSPGVWRRSLSPPAATRFTSPVVHLLVMTSEVFHVTWLYCWPRRCLGRWRCRARYPLPHSLELSIRKTVTGRRAARPHPAQWSWVSSCPWNRPDSGNGCQCDRWRPLQPWHSVSLFHSPKATEGENIY